MDKQTLIKGIKNSASQGQITKDELIRAYEEGAGAEKDNVLTKRVGISDILYYIGGAIVFIGIAVLVWQNWNTLSNAVKILTTLGSAVLAYIIGILLCRKEKLEAIGQAFYFISALVLPIGLHIIFDIAGLETDSAGTMSLLFAILFVFFLASYYILKKNIFIIFVVIFGTLLFVTFTNYILVKNTNIEEEKILQYQMLTVGLAYMPIGYLLSRGEKKFLTGPLYSFGSVFFLGAAMLLGGNKPHANAFWEIIFPFLVFGIMLLSVVVKSKAFLTFGALFLMVYILKITSEYFAEGLGWPISLVIAGLLLMFIGYFTLHLKKKYFS